jgi:hypothetical protein
MVVPRDGITKMEVSLGRRSRGHKAWIGGLLGGAAGAIAVLATPSSSEDFSVVSKGEGAVAATIMGAGLGALIGLAIPPGEKWAEVPIGPRVTLAPGHKGGVHLSFSFGF